MTVWGFNILTKEIKRSLFYGHYRKQDSIMLQYKGKLIDTSGELFIKSGQNKIMFKPDKGIRGEYSKRDVLILKPSGREKEWLVIWIANNLKDGLEVIKESIEYEYYK